MRRQALDGFCPACMLQGALGVRGNILATEPPPAPAEAPARLSVRVFAEADTDYQVLGDYELRKQVGRGGMGVVYRARQISLDRTVAVKLILMGAYADQPSVRRFRAEATAAAKLHHPNIVAIYEVGEKRGQHYFSMDYVPGPNLEDYVREHPFTARQAAQLMRTIAEAIHYAHQHGIIHRDLKPSNILMDDEGEPHITDFGLAKQFGDSHSSVFTSHSTLTLSGQVLGSPSFLPPEQASGKRGHVGQHTDVYALGAILYYLVTGRPPFAAETIPDTLRAVLNEEPASPRLLNRSVPRDLETVCLKCLEKEPGGRYASAEDLADELNRFLNGEPIEARRVASPVRVWRWCRRKPALAAAIALGFVLALGSPIAALHIAHERTLAQQSVTRLEIQLAEQRFTDDDASTALAYLARVLRREPQNRVAAERILWALSQRNFCLPVLVLKHSGPVLAATYSPDGSRILTGSQDGTASLWDSSTGKQVAGPLNHTGAVTAIRFSLDGTKLATGSADKTARVWDARSGQPLTPSLRHDGSVTSLDFSHDGKWLATASEDGKARVWDATSGLLLTGPLAHSNAVSSVSFSPAGEWLLTSSYRYVFIWEARTGLPHGPAFTDGNFVNHATFIQDGTRILMADANGRATIREVSTGTQVSSVGPVENCRTADLSPEGARIAIGGNDAYGQVWESKSGRALTPHLKHAGVVRVIRFSPDGRRLLTGSEDSTVRIWDAVTGQALTEPMRHGGSIRSAEFSPDGQRVLTVSAGGHALVWEIRTGQPLAIELPHRVGINYVRFSPDGKSALTVGYDGIASIWDPLSGAFRTNTPRLRFSNYWPMSVDFSRDSHRFIVGSWQNQAFIFDAITGERVCPPLQHPRTAIQEQHLVCARFSPDGARAATFSTEGTARIWDSATGALLRILPHGGIVNTLGFNPDGTQLVTACDDGKARVWDSSTGRRVRELQHEGAVKDASFSPNGKLIVTASHDKTARLWDARTGRQVGSPFRHKSEVRAAFSGPDGRKLFTVCDRVAFVWDLRHPGRTEPRVLSQGGALITWALSADGLRFATGSQDQTVRVWDTESGMPLSEIIRHEGSVHDTSFSPDGTWLATAPGDAAGSGQRARIIEVPTATRPIPVWLCDLAEAVAGQRRDERNAEVSVTPEAMMKLRQLLSAEQGNHLYSRWAKWFFADTRSRKISPSSRITTQEYIQRRIAEKTLPSLEKALLLSPTNSVAMGLFVRLALHAGQFDGPGTLAWADWQMRGLLNAGNQAQTPELLATRAAVLTALWRQHHANSAGTNYDRTALRRFHETLSGFLGRKHQKGTFMNTISNWPFGGALAAALFYLSQWTQSLATELHVPAQYPTIQAAVDAAQSGDTVRIAAGDYYEQLLINNKTNLTLFAEPGATLHATPGLAQTLPTWTISSPIVGILRSDVVLSGLTIHGDHLGDTYATRFLNGIFFLGSDALLTNCTIKGFRGPTLETQTYARGLTFWNGLSLGTNFVRLEVFKCAFEDNETSLFLSGDDEFNPTLTRTLFRIEGNTITGPGLSAVAGGGISITPGAKGEIIGNVITGHTSTIDPAENIAGGVAIFDGFAWVGPHRQPVPIPDITFENNTFASNNIHLWLMLADNSRIQNNVFRGHGPVSHLGGVSLSGRNITLANNDFSDMPTGIVLMSTQTFLGVHLGTAVGTKLLTNWFSNVTNPVQVQPGVPGLQQQGTRLAPFRPEFQSIARAGTNQAFTLSVRCWHGLPLALEASADLRDWAPLATNTAPLPSFEFTAPTVPDARQQFYRLRGPSR